MMKAMLYFANFVKLPHPSLARAISFGSTAGTVCDSMKRSSGLLLLFSGGGVQESFCNLAQSLRIRDMLLHQNPLRQNIGRITRHDRNPALDDDWAGIHF